MVKRRSTRNTLGLLLALGLPATDSAARVLALDVERVETALGRVEGVQLRIDWPDDADSGQLEFAAKLFDAGELGYRFRELRWQCTLELDRAAQHHACEGELRSRGQGSATLAASWQQGTLELSLRQGKGRLAVLAPPDAAPVKLLAQQLPADWLQPVLHARWETGHITAGTLDAQLSLTTTSSGSSLSGPLTLNGFGLDSSDGRVATASLDLTSQVAFEFEPDATRIAIDGRLQGGELLAGPFYAGLPESPVALALALQGDSSGGWLLQRLHWSDPGVFELDASGRLEPQSAHTLRRLHGELRLPDLGLAQPRYLDSLLGTAGLAGTRLGGAAQLRFELDEGRPRRLALGLDAVDVLDGAARFALDDLAGQLHWTDANEAVASQLRWASARLYQVQLGGAALALTSARRSLGLGAPVVVPLLGGELQLERASWQPADAQQRTALDLAFGLSRIDLGQLSAALDWPRFRGTLSGRIPGVRYVDEVLSLDGGLSVEVFDGKVEAASLSLERPLGVAPTLSADLAFSALDLKPLTGAFGFGEITGRLDGAVRSLRLVDWQPVAFDADLHTTPGAKGPRRISRRAVDDLSRVGGAGLAAGLQNQLLKLFDTFGYARIGLKCRLAENVCHMDGLDSSGAGYTIVEGSGLPRITVIGHQRQVDWPVLVARLKAATEGQAPIVQ